MGRSVTSIAVEHPASLTDEEVRAIARNANRLLITDDRDLGELIFARGLPHSGVIYLRQREYADLSLKLDRVTFVLEHYSADLNRFLVVTPRHVRTG